MPTTLCAPSSERGLMRYLSEIRRLPILEPKEEYMLGKRWRDHEDWRAAEKLIASHLRLVAKIAMRYLGYGLPIGELISEGNLGLIQAVKRFEPERGFRLSTYAMWWIRASIQEYVLRSWSLVRMGATASHRKLFFNLRKAKSQLSAYEDGDLRAENVAAIATRLGVRQKDVIDMNRRLGGDASLNARLRDGEEGSGEWQDRLVDDRLDQEHLLVQHEESDNRHMSLRSALDLLNSRERRILEARRLSDHRVSLGTLALEFRVSAERVRQIEARAFEKVRRAVCAGVAQLEVPLVVAYAITSGFEREAQGIRVVKGDRSLH
ncbi:MAG: RNA polymerase sigma factor RpoH [Methylocystis sp.]